MVVVGRNFFTRVLSLALMVRADTTVLSCADTIPTWIKRRMSGVKSSLFMVLYVNGYFVLFLLLLALLP